MHDLAYIKELNRVETLRRTSGPTRADGSREYVLSPGPSAELFYETKVELDKEESDKRYDAKHGHDSVEPWGPASSWTPKGGAAAEPVLPAGRHNTGWPQSTPKPYGSDDPIYRSGYEAGRADARKELLHSLEGAMEDATNAMLRVSGIDPKNYLDDDHSG